MTITKFKPPAPLAWQYADGIRLSPSGCRNATLKAIIQKSVFSFIFSSRFRTILPKYMHAGNPQSLLSLEWTAEIHGIPREYTAKHKWQVKQLAGAVGEARSAVRSGRG